MDPLGRVRFAVRAAGFAALTGGVVYSHRLFSRFDEEVAGFRGKQRFTSVWSHGVVPLFGLDLDVEGERPRALGPFLVVANHRSPLDIFVGVHLVGGVVLSHHGVRDIPVVGLGARATDTIFVDRADQRSGARAIREMRTRLKEGRNVIVFPEGTTFEGDEVRPFKRGSFSAARGVGAKVLPLGIAYRPGAEFVREKFGQYLVRMTSSPRTPIWITIGEPIEVPKSEADEAAIQRVVQGLVDRSAARRDQA